MRVNGLFLFCCACVPGAGQMYLGYMKRGLSLIALFCAIVMVCIFLPFCSVMLPVVWMFAFFDSYNLRRMLQNGTFPADDYLYHFEPDDRLTQMFKARYKLVGWAFIGAGLYALYDTLVEPLLWNLVELFPQLHFIHSILNRMPTLVVSVLLIWAGLKLVAARPAPEQDYSDYTAPHREEME